MGTKTVTDDQAAEASTADLAQAAGATVVDHDRAVTPTGEGRIRFKGHRAEAGYPYRIYEGQVQALVGDDWVAADEAERVE